MSLWTSSRLLRQDRSRRMQKTSLSVIQLRFTSESLKVPQKEFRFSKNNVGIRRTFVVRKISYGVGVERIFPLHSPRIDRIEVVRKGRVRRAKLYYLRSKVGKAAKVKELIRKKAD